MIFIIFAWHIQDGDFFPGIINMIKRKYKDHYIFFIQHAHGNKFSNGALFNIGVQIAGLSLENDVLFINFVNGKLIESPIISVQTFMNTNGYDNYALYATDINSKKRPACGYKDIYALWSHETTMSKDRLFYYTVDIDLDRCLKNNFLSDIMNIKI